MAVAALVTPLPAAAQSDDFTVWARDRAVPLPGCTTNATALDAVKPVVGTARIVALGEPAHGAHQPLAFRNCLFRYLVEQAGFTAIALETGLNESRRLQDYVAGGPGEARQVAQEGFTWGFGRFEENVALLSWIRRYNADPAHPRKIHVYGIDLSGGDSSGFGAKARITLDASLAYLARVAPRRTARERRPFGRFLDRFSQASYDRLSSADRARMRSAIDRLIAVFDRDRATLIAASSEADHAWARRNAVVARQLEALFRVSPPEPAGDDLPADGYKADAVRDAAMAENVRWALEREGPAGRVLLFAHNGHIMNAPTRGGIWSVYAQAPAVMGQHLKAALGRDLLILPISAAVNGPGLPQTPQGAGSLDAVLARTGLSHFLLDVRDARGIAWLTQDQSFRATFTTETRIVPATAFDALVFFDRLTPAAKISAVP